jgi:hypothetical protein
VTSRSLAIWIPIAAVAFAATPARTATLRVPSNFVTIQGAIDAATPGDTVLLSDGVYFGPGNRDLDFGGRAIVLRSENGASATTIDCQATADDRHRAIRLHAGEGPGTVIEGLTFTGGFAPADGLFGESFGGAVLVDSGSAPRITGCIFRRNVARHLGGGLAVAHGSAPEVVACTFGADSCLYHPSTTGGGWGGGAGVWQSTATFSDCIFRDNRANLGGGLSADESDIHFDRCLFTRNEAPDFGAFQPPSPGNGGGLLLNRSNAEFSLCTFDRNTARAHPVIAAWGGGAALFFSSARFSGCTFSENTAQAIGVELGRGGGMYCSFTSPVLEKTIIAFSRDAEAIFCIDGQSQPLLSCCDVFGNEEGDWTGPIALQQSAGGNFSLEPGFCGRDFGELTLRDDSPCLPPGNVCGVQVGAFGLGCITTDVEDGGDDRMRPSDFALYANYPNPFNAGTTIRISSESPSAELTLAVFNSLGRRITVLYRGLSGSGDREVHWDGRDEVGREVGSGIYLFVLDARGRRLVQRGLLLK